MKKKTNEQLWKEIQELDIKLAQSKSYNEHWKILNKLQKLTQKIKAK
jgi:hypothetical protein